VEKAMFRDIINDQMKDWIKDLIKEEEGFTAECYAPEHFKCFQKMAESLISHGIEHYRTRDYEGMSSPEYYLFIYQSYSNIAVGCELLLKAVYLKNGYMINQTKNKKVVKFSDPTKDDVERGKTHSFKTLIDSAETTIFNDITLSAEEKDYIKNIFELLHLKRNNLVHAGRKHFDSFVYPKCIGEGILLFYNRAFLEEERDESFCNKLKQFASIQR